jgi:hypothetical protein
MTATDADWARAYAKQALSDLRAREALITAKAEKCHRLHFLQMAAEKICKASLVKTHGHDQVRRTHACVQKQLPNIAREVFSRNKGTKTQSWQMKSIRRFAREIELVAPACDAADTREDNSEYPWLDAQGTVQTPCDYSFPDINDGDKMIVQLIRLIRSAAEDFAR